MVGKRRSIVNWMEYCAEGFRQIGVPVKTFCTNGCTSWQHWQLKIAQWRGQSILPLQLQWLEQSVQSFQPSLVLFIGAYTLPIAFFEQLKALPRSPLMAGWIGDRFQPQAIVIAQLLHRVYYTDSQFLDEAKNFQFPEHGRFFPLAVNPKCFFPNPALSKEARMVFIANPTPHRMEIVAQIDHPITLHGRHWNRIRTDKVQHEIHAKRLPIDQLPKQYCRYQTVLNIRNENNVLSGLSQRSFEPLACGTPVLHDAMPDLPRCFEPNHEVLVYHHMDELNEQYRRLRADITYAKTVGEAGRKRVLAEHTYAHRAQAILSDLQLT